MTDSTSWQPPAGATPPPAPSPYASPAGPPPAVGATAPGTPPGWTPPPKPGLIPLRPLTFGTLLGASFQVLRRNPRPTFGFALLVTGLIYVVGFGIMGFVAVAAFSRIQFSEGGGADADAIAAGSFGLVLVSALVPVGLAVVGSAILQGIVSLEVARGTLGEKLRLPGLWAAAKGRIGALIGWSAMIAGAVILAIAVVSVGIGLLVAFGGVAGVVVAVLLGLLFGALAVALAVWLGTKLALVPSVLMLERLTLRAALARSWSLTRGYFWKTFGIILLVSFIIQTITSVISFPLQIVASYGTVLIDPNGSQTGAIVAAVVVSLLSILFALVFGAIGAVVQGATPALLYIDIRMRKEGLDLELGRFVEARQAGDTTVQDPYLRATSPPTTTVAPSTSPWS